MYSDLKRPYERSYWVIPGSLLAGCYPGDRNHALAQTKLASLLDVGIRSILNLMEENETGYGGEPFVPYLPILDELCAAQGTRVAFRRFPVRDGFAPSLNYMDKILDHIDSEISEKTPTYVHCWGGRGRTGTIIACYLLRHGRADISNVLSVVQRLRINDTTGGPAPETRAQHDFLREFAETLT
jgi:hypothetical protein